MKRVFWIYLLMVIFGLVALAWPEDDNLMYIRFSETHGPSKLDLAGLMVIMMGFLPMVKAVWKRREYVRMKLGKALWNVMLFLSIVPLPLVALALFISNDLLLWTIVAICSVSQSVLIFFAFRQTSNQRA